MFTYFFNISNATYKLRHRRVAIVSVGQSTVDGRVSFSSILVKFRNFSSQ